MTSSHVANVKSILENAKRRGLTLKQLSRKMGLNYNKLITDVAAIRKAGHQLPEFPRGRQIGFRKERDLSAWTFDPFEDDEQDDLEDEQAIEEMLSQETADE